MATEFSNLGVNDAHYISNRKDLKYISIKGENTLYEIACEKSYEVNVKVDEDGNTICDIVWIVCINGEDEARHISDEDVLFYVSKEDFEADKYFGKGSNGGKTRLSALISCTCGVNVPVDNKDNFVIKHSYADKNGEMQIIDGDSFTFDNTIRKMFIGDYAVDVSNCYFSIVNYRKHNPYNYVHEDGTTEKICPAAHRLHLSDEQKDAARKVFEAITAAKRLGVRIVFDYNYYELIAFNDSNIANCGYDVEYDEDDKTLEYVGYDTACRKHDVFKICDSELVEGFSDDNCGFVVRK